MMQQGWDGGPVVPHFWSQTLYQTEILTDLVFKNTFDYPRQITNWQRCDSRILYYFPTLILGKHI